MAQLHRRVPGLSDPHGLIPGLLLLLVAASAATAGAQAPPEVRAERDDPRLARLLSLRGDLGSDDAETRAAAVEALTHLDEADLPAIRARLDRVARLRPSHAWAIDIFRQFRRHAGSERADDDVDVLPGVLPVLAAGRHRRVIRMVEPLLLWRSLERLGSFEATVAMHPLVSLDDGVWFQEALRVSRRMGPNIVAAAIVGRGREGRYLRRWAQRTMRAHQAEEPGRLVQVLDEAHLPDALSAYALLRMQSAMPVIASYLGDDRRAVRQAARWAIERYGRNAVWVLRDAYKNRAGEDPPTAWGPPRLRREVYALADGRRLGPVREARAAAIAARDEGRWDDVAAGYAEVLARSPELDDDAAGAEDLAALGAARLASGDREGAGWAYRRALRLAPDHPERSAWIRAAWALEGDRLARLGVLDEETRRRATANGLAAAAAPVVAPDAAPGGWRVLGIALLVLLGVAVLRVRASSWSAPEEDDEPTLELDDDTLADATLPG